MFRKCHLSYTLLSLFSFTLLIVRREQTTSCKLSTDILVLWGSDSMSNLSQFENLISEELTAESQATIAGGAVINFNDEIFFKSMVDDVSFDIDNIDVKFDDIEVVVADDKNRFKAYF